MKGCQIIFLCMTRLLFLIYPHIPSSEQQRISLPHLIQREWISTKQLVQPSILEIMATPGRERKGSELTSLEAIAQRKKMRGCSVPHTSPAMCGLHLTYLGVMVLWSLLLVLHIITSCKTRGIKELIFLFVDWQLCGCLVLWREEELCTSEVFALRGEDRSANYGTRSLLLPNGCSTAIFCSAQSKAFGFGHSLILLIHWPQF